MNRQLIDKFTKKFPELVIALLSGNPGRGMLRKLLGVSKSEMRALCNDLSDGGIIVVYDRNNTIRATQEAQEYLLSRYLEKKNKK